MGLLLAVSLESSDMWLQTIGLTLLFFVISTGFGLFILVLASPRLIEASGLSRLELLIFGFTIGAPGSGTFLQLLCLVQRDLKIDLAVLSLISLIGLFTTRSLWRVRRPDLREIAIWIAIVIPLATMTWWSSFGAFSSFPFTDIGADAHWMKIAQEFSDTGVLNPYAGQTYSDLRAAVAGLLSGTLGLDLLQFHWAYRYLSILCLGLFFYAAANRLFLDSGRKWFFVLFAVSTNTLGILTNGSLAIASSFVFLAMLVGVAPIAASGQTLLPSTIVPAATALAAVVIAFLLNNNSLLLAVLPAVLLTVNAVGRSSSRGGGTAASLLITSAWPIALIFVHRSAYLFVAIVIASWLFYVAVLSAASRPQPRLLKSLWVAGLLLPSICVLGLLYIAAARAGYAPKVSANSLFSHLTRFLLGRGLNEGDEIMLGTGPEVAAIEISRAIGPAFPILIGGLYLWWCAKNRPARLIQQVAIPGQSAAILRLLWSWIAACTFSLAVLSGFPFLYRILFVVLGLFTVATTELFCQFIWDPAPAPVGRLSRVSFFALALITALTIGVYAFSWWPDLPYSTYQTILRPMQIGLLAVAAVCAGLTFSNRRRTQIVGAAVVISLSVAIDRSAVANLFRVYSYGRPPVGATFISHYSASELATDRWLHENLPKSIVITDPVTLAMARAVAGVPGLYLFSNLDTVYPPLADNIREAISAIVRPESDSLRTVPRACAIIAPMMDRLNVEARAQMGAASLTEGMLKAVRPGVQLPVVPILPDSGVGKEMAAPRIREETLKRAGETAAARAVQAEAINSAMAALQTPDGTWNLVAIINPRTMQWLHLGPGGRLSYFPVDRPLDPELLERFGRGDFPLLYSDGQNAVLLIRCTQPTAY